MTRMTAEQTSSPRPRQSTPLRLFGAVLLLACVPPAIPRVAAQEIYRAVGQNGEASFSDVPAPDATPVAVTVHQPTATEGALAQARTAELLAVADELAAARAAREQERRRHAQMAIVQTNGRRKEADSYSDSRYAGTYPWSYPGAPSRPHRPPWRDDEFSGDRQTFAPPAFAPPAFMQPQPLRVPMRSPDSRVRGAPPGGHRVGR